MKKTSTKHKLHAAPIIGISASLLVLTFFNAQLLVALAMAYITPSSAYAQQETTDISNVVRDDPRVIIPKIQVDAPVVYGVDDVKEDAVQKALERGVLHFGGSPLPGKPGNAVFVGHSSNLPWATGEYKFIFMLLDKLEPGDELYLDFEGTRYTYQVIDKKVVKPNDVSVLEGSLYPKATFITCTPLGTNTNRLVIGSRLIDPAPIEGDEDNLVRSAPELNDDLPGKGANIFGR